MKGFKQDRENFPAYQIGSASLSMSQERQLGRIISAWSYLESVVEVFIWDLFSVDMEHGKIITKKLNIEARLQMLKALTALQYEEQDLVEIKKILVGISDLKEDRNFVVHGTWFRDKNGFAMVSSTRPKSDPFTVVTERFTPIRLKGLENAIRAVSAALARLTPGLQAYAASAAQSPTGQAGDVRVAQGKLPEESAPERDDG